MPGRPPRARCGPWPRRRRTRRRPPRPGAGRPALLEQPQHPARLVELLVGRGEDRVDPSTCRGAGAVRARNPCRSSSLVVRSSRSGSPRAARPGPPGAAGRRPPRRAPPPSAGGPARPAPARGAAPSSPTRSASPRPEAQPPAGDPATSSASQDAAGGLDQGQHPRPARPGGRRRARSRGQQPVGGPQQVGSALGTTTPVRPGRTTAARSSSSEPGLTRTHTSGAAGPSAPRAVRTGVAGLRLAGGRHGVLEVHHEGVGTAVPGASQLGRLVARDVQVAARDGHGHPRGTAVSSSRSDDAGSGRSARRPPCRAVQDAVAAQEGVGDGRVELEALERRVLLRGLRVRGAHRPGAVGVDQRDVGVEALGDVALARADRSARAGFQLVSCGDRGRAAGRACGPR